MIHDNDDRSLMRLGKASLGIEQSGGGSLVICSSLVVDVVDLSGFIVSIVRV